MKQNKLYKIMKQFVIAAIVVSGCLLFLPAESMACTTPSANFTASPIAVCPGGTVTFTNSSTGSATLSYAWAFQGGSPTTSTATSPIVTYNVAGGYNVTLTATTSCDGSKNTNIKTNYITVFNPCPPGIGINTIGAASSPSAILDLSSTTQGILIPRMTDAERQALKDPATGLMIYNTTSNAINFYNGAGWQGVTVSSASTTSAVGAGPGLGMAVNKSGALADASAILDVSATDKGLLIPRTTQGAVSVFTGLLIYNTATNKINFYDGTSWQIIDHTLIDNTKGNGAAGSGISINSTGSAPDASAMLDISSSTQGVLIPRMTSAQRDAVKTPAQGLILYDNTNKCIEHWAGGNWYKWVVSLVAPTATAATSITNTSFSANWTASAGATTYYLDVSTVSNFASFVGAYNNLDVGNVTTRSVTGLTAGTTYYYRVRASTACGTSPNSNTITVTTCEAATLTTNCSGSACCSGVDWVITATVTVAGWVDESTPTAGNCYWGNTVRKWVTVGQQATQTAFNSSFFCGGGGSCGGTTTYSSISGVAWAPRCSGP